MERLFVFLYRIRSRYIRSIILRLVNRLEGTEQRSNTLRSIFKKYYGVSVGLYTGGGSFRVGNFSPKTTIGRFCSIAETVRRYNADHPPHFISTHAVFFNAAFGRVETDRVERREIVIGNDVWIGHNAVILSTVSRIGNGAIIGAGTVVYQDVPDYAIVLGNPGRVVRYRFEKDMIERIEKLAWWEKPLHQIEDMIEYFTVPLTNEILEMLESRMGGECDEAT